MLNLLAAATQATGDAAAQGNIFTMLIPFALMFVVLYFFMIRPQKKRSEERRGGKECQ